ncbi:hypothetical protein YC2023_046776 [Brassica napus]
MEIIGNALVVISAGAGPNDFILKFYDIPNEEHQWVFADPNDHQIANHIMSRTCLEQENKDSVLFKQKLKKKFPQIEASLPESKFLYVNVYDHVMDMIQNRSKYGISSLFRKSL